MLMACLAWEGRREIKDADVPGVKWRQRRKGEAGGGGRGEEIGENAHAGGLCDSVQDNAS